MVNVASGHVGSHAIALTANTVHTLTFNDDLDTIEITTNAAADIYFTLDGTIPLVAGTGSWCIPAGRTIGTYPVHNDNGTIVKLITAGLTAKVWVQRGH